MLLQILQRCLESEFVLPLVVCSELALASQKKLVAAVINKIEPNLVNLVDIALLAKLLLDPN